jgi:hypothetical protein
MVLREHLLAGRLTLEEFSGRVGAALGARIAGELAAITEDLPEVFTEAPASAASLPAWRRPCSGMSRGEGGSGSAGAPSPPVPSGISTSICARSPSISGGP